MNIEEIFCIFRTAYFLPGAEAYGSPVLSSVIFLRQNRSWHEQSVPFHLKCNPACNHHFLQSDRLLQCFSEYWVFRQDREKFPVSGTLSAPFRVAYAVLFFWPVIYFPYVVLLSLTKSDFRKHPQVSRKKISRNFQILIVQTRTNFCLLILVSYKFCNWNFTVHCRGRNAAWKRMAMRMWNNRRLAVMLLWTEKTITFWLIFNRKINACIRWDYFSCFSLYLFFIQPQEFSAICLIFSIFFPKFL